MGLRDPGWNRVKLVSRKETAPTDARLQLHGSDLAGQARTLGRRAKFLGMCVCLHTYI